MDQNGTAAPKTIEAVFEDSFIEVFFATHAFGRRRQFDDDADETEVRYKGQSVDKGSISKPQVIVIPDELAAPFDRVRDRIYALIKRYCLPSDGKGRYLVPVRHAEQFILQFNTLRDEAEVAAESIAARYDAICAEFRAFWRPKVASDAEFDEKFGHRLPRSREHLRSAYKVEFRATARPRATGLRAGAVKSWFDEAFANHELHQQQLRREQYAAPIDGLREALATFAEQVRTGKRVTVAALNKVFDKITLLRACADIIGPDLVALVDDLAAEFDVIVRKATDGKEAGLSYTATFRAQRAAIDGLIARAVEACQEATTESALTARFRGPNRGMDLRSSPAVAG